MPAMTFADVLSALNEEPLPKHATAAWDASQACLPAGRPSFLRVPQLAEAWSCGGFDGALPPDVISMADRIAADETLRRFAWHVTWSLFDGPRDAVPSPWPSLRNRLGPDAGLFWLVAALAFIPAVRAYHASLGLPERITRETCLQPSCFALNHRRGHGGRWGIYGSQVPWLANYLAPNLYFRIGRFEYWRRPCRLEYRVYRHHATGVVAALAADGVLFNAAGERCFAADDPEPAGSWRAAFTETADAAAGHAIAPEGVAQRDTVKLPLGEWACVLRPDDTILDLHIPAGGGMTPDACEASFREAAALFRDRFPDPAARAVVCSSWMFSNQLEICLPPDANLVRLLRELYLLPCSCRPNDGLWFVFLQDRFDPATAPRDTGLRRAILDYLARGVPWHPGSMFLLLDDLPLFGTQPYRRRWPAAAGSPETGVLTRRNA